MNKLEELIKEFCPNGVEYISVEELLKEKTISSITPSLKIKRNDYKDFGEISIISQEEEYISGYCNIFDKKIIDGQYVCFGDHTENVKYVDFRFVQGADGLKIICCNNKEKIDIKYFYYAVCNFYKRHNNYERHYKYFVELQIPLPALPVQREIVRILDSFTLYSAELTAELTVRRKQYEFYRDKLLSFNHVQYKEVALLELLSQSITDGPHETPVFVDSGIPFISAEAIHDTRIDFSKIRGFISSEYNKQCNKKYKPQINDVFMVKSGSTTGKVAMVTDSREFNIWSPIAAMRTNKSLLPRYLFYILQTKDIQNQVVKYASNGSQPNLSMRKLEQFKIKVPPMEVQERIVRVLDNFDAICSDLGIGLPAEIEKRQKQYEYYREKLLTFDNKFATILDRQTDRQTDRKSACRERV